MNRKDYFIIIGGVVTIIIIAVCIYLSFDDMGIWNGSFQQTTFGKVSYYMGGGLMAMKLWSLWEKLMAFFWMVVTWLFVAFVICGIGVALGF